VFITIFYFKQLIARVLSLKDHYSSELPSEGQKASSSKKIDRKFVSEFSAIIESNIANENFGVDDICKEIGISSTVVPESENCIGL